MNSHFEQNSIYQLDCKFKSQSKRASVSDVIAHPKMHKRALVPDKAEPKNVFKKNLKLEIRGRQDSNLRGQSPHDF